MKTTNNNIDTSKLDKVINDLKTKKNVLLLCHSNPDGDTIGSAYALGLALAKLDIDIKIECFDKFPERFDYLTRLLRQADFDEPDYVIAVDVSDTKLLGSSLENKYLGKIDLAIDHHATHKNFANVDIVFEDYAANCEIIYYFINALGIEIDANIADCIYTGICTDTGSFQNSNTTPQAHNIVAQLMQKTNHITYINQKLFRTTTRKNLEIRKISIDNLKFFFDDKCAMLIFTKDIIEKYELKPEDISLVKSLPIEIENVKVGFVLSEKNDREFKLSLKTKGNISANQICNKFEGGGHFATAGGIVHGDDESAINQVLAEVKKYL